METSFFSVSLVSYPSLSLSTLGRTLQVRGGEEEEGNSLALGLRGFRDPSLGGPYWGALPRNAGSAISVESQAERSCRRWCQWRGKGASVQSGIPR